MQERVVVTGIGILSGIGNGFEEFAEALKAGRNGIDIIQAFDTRELKARLGCEVKYDFSREFTKKQLNSWDRSALMLVTAARQALEMAGRPHERMDPRRVGVFIGTTIGGSASAMRFYEGLTQRGIYHLSLLEDYPLYSAGARVVGEFGFSGPNVAFSSACSSSNAAIGHAADMVRHRRVDMALAGGVDVMAKITVAGFNALRNVSPRAIRPFDRHRDGMVIGEGAAVLVLERMETAHRRGVKPLAEVLGYGMSSDAYHMTAPEITGRGAALCMTRALKSAGIEPEDVDYVNAHGTGTPHNDKMEVRAIRRVFGDHAARLPVSSTKSMHGHTLGAAGAIEAIAAVAALHDQFLPPTINFQTPDPECAVDCVPNQAREAKVDIVLSNNFAFGGNNCAVVFGRA